jgi:uncharacterized OB-fold protein
MRIPISRISRCAKCGNTDCPKVADDPAWGQCPAEWGAGEIARLAALATTTTDMRRRIESPESV